MKTATTSPDLLLKVGARIYWYDPDEDSCSGYGTVVRMQHTPPDEDSVISLKMDSGAEVEALPHELRTMKNL